MKNVHEQASGLLQKKTEGLIARFLQGKEPDFLKQHARLLDDYFRQAFETSMFLIAMERYPSALISCASAIESAIKAKLKIPRFALPGRIRLLLCDVLLAAFYRGGKFSAGLVALVGFFLQ